MIYPRLHQPGPIDTMMDDDYNSEKLPFLSGMTAERIETAKSTILSDLQISNKMQRLRKDLGENNSLDEWIHKVTCEEQLEKLSRTEDDWNPKNFHFVMKSISQLTAEEAEQFFTFCRQNAVNKKWPDEYAIDLAKLALTGETKEADPYGIKDASHWEMVYGQVSSDFSCTPVPQERITENRNLNATVMAAEEISKKEPELKDSLTIVFMGTSGSGKTTMVNGIANSFRYQTFDKALKTGPRVVVPTRFTTFVGSKHKVVQPKLTINCNSQPYEENENLNDGALSVTKEPKIHEFTFNTEVGKIPFRIVDTPGLNDTEGNDQDDINLTKNFAFLETLEKIDAICIVLKANESRLTVPLKSALGKLLRRLERSTYQNVSFVFTNGKNPGGSLALLREFFKDDALNTEKENWFAFDNEPFRYLCEVREYPKAANDERKEVCQELFIHNVKELQGLLHRAECLPSFKMSPVPAERKETRTAHSGTADKIASRTSAIDKTLKKQGPSSSSSMNHERSLTRVSAKAASVQFVPKVSATDEELKRREKSKHDRTFQIVKALTEPLAEQIFNNCRDMMVLSDAIKLAQEEQARLKKEDYIYCRSCVMRCSGYFDGVSQCCDCKHYKEHHEIMKCVPENLEAANASVAMKLSAKEELEGEDDALRSACHQFSFFLANSQGYSFLKCFEAKVGQLVQELYHQNMEGSQRDLLAHSISFFLTDFKKNVENDKNCGTFGEFLTVENAEKKLTELRHLKTFGPHVNEVINHFTMPLV